MRGFIGIFVTLLIVLVSGAIGYNLGISANIAASGVPVVAPAYGWGFGFPLFGLFFGLLFLFLLFGLIGRLVWGGGRGGRGGWGPRGYGQHGWDHKTVPPVADEMLQRWHQQAHSDTPPESQPS